MQVSLSPLIHFTQPLVIHPGDAESWAPVTNFGLICIYIFEARIGFWILGFKDPLVPCLPLQTLSSRAVSCLPGESFMARLYENKDVTWKLETEMFNLAGQRPMI